MELGCPSRLPLGHSPLGIPAVFLRDIELAFKWLMQLIVMNGVCSYGGQVTYKKVTFNHGAYNKGVI